MYISGFLSYYAAYCYENSTDSPNGFLVAIIALGVAFLVGASLASLRGDVRFL
jgi:hypothetical protein